MNPLVLAWDLSREKPTVGGLLTLLAEGEAIAKLTGSSEFIIEASGNVTRSPIWPALVSVVRHHRRAQLRIGRHCDSAEVADLFECHKSSSFDTTRLSELHRRFGIQPELNWQTSLTQEAEDILKSLDKVAVGIHLRNELYPAQQTYNAARKHWQPALKSIVDTQPVALILVGHDAPVLDTRAFNNSFIDARNLPLPLQLAILTQCDFFVGSASGIANACIYSSVPLAIFKHPRHHAKQMRKEFGLKRRIRLYRPNQFILRYRASKRVILREWAAISNA